MIIQGIIISQYILKTDQKFQLTFSSFLLTCEQVRPEYPVHAYMYMIIKPYQKCMEVGKFASHKQYLTLKMF